jgi:hypothetical protein
MSSQKWLVLRQIVTGEFVSIINYPFLPLTNTNTISILALENNWAFRPLHVDVFSVSYLTTSYEIYFNSFLKIPEKIPKNPKNLKS